MLALIENNTIIATISPGGWFELPDGSRVSPAAPGWTNGTYRVETITEADSVPDGQRVISTDVQIVNGSPQYVHTLEAIPISDIQVRCVQDVKEAAQNALSPIVPGTTAEAAIRDQKVAEAKALHNDTNPDMSNYPWIDQQAQKTGVAAGQIANNILADHQAFTTYGSQIEAIKIDGIDQITTNTVNIEYYRDNAVYLIEQIGVQIRQVT